MLAILSLPPCGGSISLLIFDHTCRDLSPRACIQYKYNWVQEVDTGSECTRLRITIHHSMYTWSSFRVPKRRALKFSSSSSDVDDGGVQVQLRSVHCNIIICDLLQEKGIAHRVPRLQSFQYHTRAYLCFEVSPFILVL